MTDKCRNKECESTKVEEVGEKGRWYRCLVCGHRWGCGPDCAGCIADEKELKEREESK